MTAQLDLAATLEIAVQAVTEAGKIITEGRPEVVTDKGDRDLSTEMDIAAEQAVRKILDEHTPDIPLLGEEQGGPDPAEVCCWVLDPIDGTVNYVHNLPTYAVALSLINLGHTVIGVILLPATRDLYTAVAGGGAKVNGKPMAASSTDRLSDALVAIDQFTFVDDDPDKINAFRLALIETLTPVVQRVRITGSSAIDLAWTAEGKLDACIMLANQPWDTSAGVLLAREAGVEVFDLVGNTHQLSSRATVAVTAGVSSSLVGVLASHQIPHSLV